MYNLLVTASAGAWDNTARSYHFDGDRFLEHTVPAIAERFRQLRPDTIAELCSIPALFAYEMEVDQPAKIGRVTNIAQNGPSVSLSFQIDAKAKPIARDELLAMQVALGIANPYELRRTHWAVKGVDLPSSFVTTPPEVLSRSDGGRYRIEERLGEGGQALVSRAVDVELARSVAIKALEPFFGSPPTERDRERLRREARALAALSHPSIPAVYDIQLDALPPRIIFEFIEGTNLLQLLNQRRPRLREVGRWLLQVCSALGHAHEHGIIHRDVKPANIVLRTRTGACSLVDFGFAAVPGDKLRSSSRTAGTPAYMSPEQLRGEELDERADIYSLAVTMYQLLANKLPAPERYESLSAIDSTVPPAVDHLVQDCLRARELRPATAQQFARRLRDGISISLSLSEVLEHGELARRLDASLRSASPENYSDVVREVQALQDRLQRVTRLAGDGQVTLTDLGVDSGQSIDTIVIPLEEAVKKFKQQYIGEALEKFGGNRSQAARALDVNVRTVFRFLADGGSAEPLDRDRE